MSANIEPEETQAIMELMGAGARGDAQVSERDFRRPHRLSGQARQALVRRLQERITRMEANLAGMLGAVHPLELAGLGEASAEDVVEQASLPLAALRFVVGGQPAWIVWESIAAVAAVERILGSNAKPAARRLSHAESRVLGDLLTPIAREFSEALDSKAEGFTVAQSIEGLGSWRDGGKAADVHRLELELGIEGLGEPSTMRIYLPAPRSLSAIQASEASPAELPAHLDPVEVSVSARLAGCEVSLAQLLALEEGDVIPIDARVGDLALVTVEGCPFARARLGRRRNRLAIRIEGIEERSEESR